MKVRAAVSCLACNVPAARKIGGFVGHNGNMGCSKCLKSFLLRNLVTILIILALQKPTGNHEIMQCMYGLHINIKMLEPMRRENT